jgi:hypothetical protein
MVSVIVYYFGTTAGSFIAFINGISTSLQTQVIHNTSTTILRSFTLTNIHRTNTAQTCYFAWGDIIGAAGYIPAGAQFVIATMLRIG